MASPAKENGAKGFTLTERDIEILQKAWKCMRNAPEIDYTRLAAECSMKNVGSASNAWGKIKKKLFIEAGSAATSANGDASSPNGNGNGNGNVSRKRKPADISVPAADVANGEPENTWGSASGSDASPTDGGGGDNVEADEAAPSTPKRRRTAAGTGSDATPKTPSKTPRTPRTPKTPKTPKTVGTSSRSRGRKTAKSAAAVKAEDSESAELDELNDATEGTVAAGTADSAETDEKIALGVTVDAAITAAAAEDTKLSIAADVFVKDEMADA